MKKAIALLSLLLVLAAVSIGPGIARAGTSAQDPMIQGNPLTSYEPQDDNPGDEVECLGDPDDAITGNRHNGVASDVLDLDALTGMPNADTADYGTWIALLRILLYLGLI